VEIQIEDLGMGDSVRYDTEAGKDGKGPRAINVSRA
jgi:cold shock CspA family protein